MDHTLSQMVHILLEERIYYVDLFITNFPSLITLIDTIPGVSDHEIDMVKFPGILSAIYSKINELEDLQSTFNDVDPYYEDTETPWTMFRDKLCSVTDQYIPCRRHHDFPWLTPMLRFKIRCKNNNIRDQVLHTTRVGDLSPDISIIRQL